MKGVKTSEEQLSALERYFKDGLKNKEIASITGMNIHTVRAWRERMGYSLTQKKTRDDVWRWLQKNWPANGRDGWIIPKGRRK